MPIHGVYPSIAQPSSAAAAEPGRVQLTYHPLELFDFDFIWDFSGHTTGNITKSGDEITQCDNTGTQASSGGHAVRTSSGAASVGPDHVDAIAEHGYLRAAECYTPSGGTGRGLQAELPTEIGGTSARSVVTVWSLDYTLDGGNGNAPLGLVGDSGTDHSFLKWSGSNYNFQGGNWRSTNINFDNEEDDDYVGLRIAITSWTSRKTACYESDSSTTYTTINSHKRPVDTVNFGFQGSAYRSLRGHLIMAGIILKDLTESEVNSLGRALCFACSGNSTAQTSQTKLPKTWSNVDFSTSHASLSHEPYAYIDNQTNDNLTTSTDDETFSVDATDTLTIASSSTVAAGDKLVVSTTGTLPTGLATSTDYFVHSRPTSTTIKLSSSYANVWAGTEMSITSGTGSGTHTLTRTLVDKIDCDTNAVRHFDPSGSNKVTYIESSGAQVGALLGSSASSGSYSWTNASEQDDGSIVIVGRKHSSASHSARSCSVGSASGGDQYIEFGGASGRARAKFAGGLVTCSGSFSDGELFVAYFTFDSASAGHELHVYDTSTQTWTSSGADTSSTGEVFFERWQKLGVEVGSKLEIMECIFFENHLTTANINTNNSALASSYGFTHSDLS